MHGNGLPGDVVKTACLSDPVIVPRECSDSQWHEIESIPLLSPRSILNVDLESGRRARGLQQGVLGTVPVIPALAFGNGRVVERVILEVDLGNRPCRVLMGMSTDKVRDLFAQECPPAKILDLGILIPEHLIHSRFGSVAWPRASSGFPAVLGAAFALGIISGPRIFPG